METTELLQYRRSLRRKNYSAHTVKNYVNILDYFTSPGSRSVCQNRCSPAVALGCCNLATPQEVLDGCKVSIGVKKLRGHGVAKPMTRDVQAALSRIGFERRMRTKGRAWIPMETLNNQRTARKKGNELS